MITPQEKVIDNDCPSLRLARPLAIAAHDLHLIRRNHRLIIQFEVDILDEECPHFVAEAVGIQMALLIIHPCEQACVLPLWNEVRNVCI